MIKETFGGLLFALLVTGSALAHEGAEGAQGAVAVTPQCAPGQGAAAEPAKEAAVEYKFGVNGFLRGEGVGNLSFSDFSYTPKHSEGRFLYRVKPYATWNPTDYLSLHVEGQGYGFTGSGHDEGKVSFYQGYLDAKLPEKDLISLRAGRQEFSYGSTFMLGPDSFYNGLSFDAARIRVQPTASLSVDLLGGFYAPAASDGVKGNLSGVYASWNVSEGNTVEGYGLRDTGSLDRHRGEELYSWGLRTVTKLGPVNLEVEPVYQSGERFNALIGRNETIDAYGGHADLGGEFDLAGLHQRYTLGYAIGSGSQAAADGTSSKREFRNANNDTCILGDMNVFGDLSGLNVAASHASGLQIYTLGWGVDLTKQLAFSATGHYFRAGNVASGLSRDLGMETDFNLTYTFSEDYSLILAYDHLFTGSFFRGASGSDDDVHYGYAMLQFNLEKSKLKAPKL